MPGLAVHDCRADSEAAVVANGRQLLVGEHREGRDAFGFGEGFLAVDAPTLRHGARRAVAFGITHASPAAPRTVLHELAWHLRCPARARETVPLVGPSAVVVNGHGECPDPHRMPHSQISNRPRAKPLGTPCAMPWSTPGSRSASPSHSSAWHSAQETGHEYPLLNWDSGADPEAAAVAAVVRGDPVVIRRAAVPGVVVPSAAA